jgi:hypothetical protein
MSAPCQYFSSSNSSGLPAPPGITRRRLRDLYADPSTRIPGSFKGPGRIGILVSVADYDAWLRAGAAPANDIERQVAARWGR